MAPELEELKEILKLLREFGVSEFVGLNYTLKLCNDLPSLIKAPDQLTEAQQKDVIQRIESMKSVMQLDDDNLIDRLFPAQSEGNEENSPQ